MYIGSLAFGVTSCDPATVAVSSLPEDADMLLDRWIHTSAANRLIGSTTGFHNHGEGPY